MKRSRVLLALAVLCTASCFGNSAAEEVRAQFTERELARILRTALVAPMPDPTNAFEGNADAIDLGRRLFYDQRLSGNGEVSCASCHDPAQGWTDGRQKAVGVNETGAHTPALTNVAHNRWFFWDGRADSLWSQALQPIEHPDEQGGSRLQTLHLLAEDPDLAELYGRVFGELPQEEVREAYPRNGRPVPEEPEHAHQLAWASLSEQQQQEVNLIFSNAGKAIAAFERCITTNSTAFDRFVDGLRTGDADDLAAISAEARSGAALFFGEARCHLCHSGQMLSDLEFHDVRVPRSGDVEPGRWDGIAALVADPFNGAGVYSDDKSQSANVELRHLRRTRHNAGEFKTPSLRDVSRTAPYMHSGAFSTLEEVVEHYSTLEGAAPFTHEDSERVLIPLNLDQAEKRQLIAFLRSLTAPLPAPPLLAPAAALKQSVVANHNL